MRFVSVYTGFKAVTGPGYLHLGLFVAQMIFLRKPSPAARYNFKDGKEGAEHAEKAWQLVQVIRYSHLAVGIMSLLSE